MNVQSRTQKIIAGIIFVLVVVGIIYAVIHRSASTIPGSPTPLSADQAKAVLDQNKQTDKTGTAMSQTSVDKTLSSPVSTAPGPKPLTKEQIKAILQSSN